MPSIHCGRLPAWMRSRGLVAVVLCLTSASGRTRVAKGKLSGSMSDLCANEQTHFTLSLFGEATALIMVDPYVPPEKRAAGARYFQLSGQLRGRKGTLLLIAAEPNRCDNLVIVPASGTESWKDITGDLQVVERKRVTSTLCAMLRRRPLRSLGRLLRNKNVTCGILVPC